MTLIPFDAKSDAEPASTPEQEGRRKTRKAAPLRTDKFQRYGLIGQEGLEPSTKGL